MDGRESKDVWPGLTTDIVLMQDQRTVRLTRSVTKGVLTKSAFGHTEQTCPLCAPSSDSKRNNATELDLLKFSDCYTLRLIDSR